MGYWRRVPREKDDLPRAAYMPALGAAAVAEYGRSRAGTVNNAAIKTWITMMKDRRARRRYEKLPYHERTRQCPFMRNAVTGAVEALAVSIAAEGYTAAPAPTIGDVGAVAQPLGLPLDAIPLFLAEMQWATAGFPLWAINAELAALLSNTDPPLQGLALAAFSAALRLPFCGLQLVLPPLLRLEFPGTAATVVESIVLAESAAFSSETAVRYRDAVDEAARNAVMRTATWHPALLAVAVGTISGPQRKIITPHRLFCPGDAARMPSEYASMAPFENFVLNFLVALNASYLATSCRNAPKAQRAKKRREVHERQITHAYTYVSLTGPKQPPGAPTERDKRPTDRTQRSHWVRGHWHAYWGKDAGECMILDSRELEDGTVLFKYLRWIKPYLTGVDQAPQPRYRSKE